MIELPLWLEKQIDSEFKCPNCSGKMNKEFVTGFGVKESSKHQDTQVCWIEYYCMLCDRRSHIEIRPYTMKQLCEDMEEKIESDAKQNSKAAKKVKRRRRKAAKRVVSKIGDDEVQKAKEILASDNWYEVMIGF